MPFRFETIFNKFWFPLGVIFFTLFISIFQIAYLNDDQFIFEGITVKGGDYDEQFKTVESLVNFGTLSMDAAEGGAPYANRTPGYIFPYIIFAWLLPTFWAWQMHGVFQILFTVIASRLLFKIIYESTSRFYISLLSFFIYIGCSYFSWLAVELSPDNMSVNAFICALYFFKKFHTTRELKHIFISGLFLAWCAHLRGFTLLYIPVFIGFLIILYYKDLRSAVKPLFIFLFPFIFITGIWTIRNYIQFKEIIPLQRAYLPYQKFNSSTDYYDPAKYSVCVTRKLVGSWGGNCMWYYPNTEMNWILSSKDSIVPDFIPNKVFNAEFTKENFSDLKAAIQLSYSGKLSNREHDSLENLIIESSTKYKISVLKNNPSFYITSPLKRIYHMFNKNPSVDWRVKPNSIAFYYRFISTLLYYLFLFLSVVSLFFIRNFQFIQKLCLCLLLVIIFEFGFLIELFHFKYFITSYVCIMILSAFSIKMLTKKYFNKS